MSNIFIVDKKIIESAKKLDRQRLFSSIYEGIQILASNLDFSDQLVTPKRNIKNKKISKYWKSKGFVFSHCILFLYYDIWYNKFANKKETIYNETINYINLLKLRNIIFGVCEVNELVIDLTFNDKDYIKKCQKDLYEKDPIFYKYFFEG